MKYKEIPNKRNVPQIYTTTSYITLRLCKLNASRTAIMEYKNHAENPIHSCKTNPQKKMLKKAPQSASKPYTDYQYSKR